MNRSSNRRETAGAVNALLLAVGIAIVTVTGCDLLISRDSLMIEPYPGHPDQVIGVDEQLHIVFDRPMDRHSVESLLRVDSDRGTVGGTSQWQDAMIRFTPHHPLLPGTRYRLRLHGHVSDVRGREHRVSLDLPFFAGDRHHRPPDAVASQPPSGSIIAPTDPIQIRFSAPMNERVTERHVSLQPAAEHTRTWQNDGRTLNITPSSRWNTPSILTISLASDAVDRVGAPMVRERSFSFFVQGISSRPAVTSVDAVALNDGREPATDAWLDEPGADVTDPDAVIPLWSAIRIRFSHAMDRTSVERAWRIEPAIAGSLRWRNATTVAFVPAAPLEPGVIYRISLAPQASDVDGNRIGGAWEQTVSATDAGLTLVQLLVSGYPDAITEFSGTERFLLHASVPPYFAMLFHIEFSHPFRSAAEKQAVVHALSITRLLPGGQSPPTAVQYGWMTDRVLSVSYHGFTPPGSDEQALFLLRIPGGPEGIQTSGGHRMSTDIDVLFHMEES